MAVGITTKTIKEFEAFVVLPENADRHFEFIRGEIVEVVSNNYSSMLAMRIGGRLMVFAEQHALGRVTGADGGYIISGERYIPDAAFISSAKQQTPSDDTYNPVPPDLAVEVLSPSDSDYYMRVKVANYLAAGTRVWVVDPDTKTVEDYVPGKPVKQLSVADVLEGDPMLPGFILPVTVIFAD